MILEFDYDMTKKKMLTKIYNEIGFKLLSIMMTGNNDNICISPFSIMIILSVLLDGASGETRNELMKIFKMTKFENKEFDKLNKEIINDLKIETANSIWTNKDYEINEDFVKSMNSLYNCDIKKMYDDVKKNVTEINKWIEIKTHNKIGKIVTEDLLKKILVFIINSVYFKKKWMHPFDKTKTEEEFFYFPDGEYTKCLMMSSRERYMMYRSTVFNAVRLPYNEDMSMILFTSDSRDMDIVRHRNEVFMVVENWKSWFNSKEINLTIPKFKINYKRDILNDVLNLSERKYIGPEFDNMGKGELIVDGIIHNSNVEIDEGGVEVSAITMAGCSGYSGEQGECNFYMIFERPFLFFIYDDNTGLILFSGRVYNPNK